jgi:pimeloyl-ACP methyl ester carboxylesterase
VIVPNFVRLETYNRLGDFLESSLGYERGRDLIEFAFDWRHDIRASARLLAQTIDAWGVTSPITIIAHSLGCVVSRYYVERFGGKDKVERLVLIGGPNYGSPTPLSNLLVGPNLLPFGLLGDRMREMVATWPMMYQLLPIYTCAHDQEGRPLEVLNDEGWVEDWQLPFVKDARRFRRELGSQSSVPCVSIYGYGSDTPASLTVQRDVNGRWEKVNFVHDKHGDGTIQESSAMFKNSEIHPVEQNHGTLYVDNDVKRRLKAELQRQETA